MQVCLSKAGPELSHLIATATRSMSGKVTTSNTLAITTSPRRLI
jgi:hypothetical protein